MFKNINDIKENDILFKDEEVLNILLYDNSSKSNIVWATDNYIENGEGFSPNEEIKIEKITGDNGELIKPRIEKTDSEKLLRIKNKAEVFTPSWICNEQNNLADDNWFGYKNVFNKSCKQTWETNYNKVKFIEKSWQDYVLSQRLEIACGEAPYLASRYDMVTGIKIEIKDRIGLLDRKLRVITENITDEDKWIEWSILAVKSIYGFDWQGDNVLLARENILYTFIENYIEIFQKEPNMSIIKEVATIISWNVWQMDGIKYVIPNTCKNEENVIYTLFGEEVQKIECEGCKRNDNKKHNGIYCKIMNWDSNKIVKFSSIVNRK